MIYLIQYNRPTATLVALRRYDDVERIKAQSDRLALEIDLNQRGVNHEVVMLEAANEEALRNTHQRYFENGHELIESLKRVAR